MAQFVFTLVWESDDLVQDKEDFLLAAPNQTLEQETPLTDIQWIKKKIAMMTKGQVMRGRRERLEAAMETPTEPDIEVT